jgi:hypothetical protein
MEVQGRKVINDFPPKFDENAKILFRRMRVALISSRIQG